MAHTCRLVPEHALAVVCFDGVVDDAEAIIATGELALDPHWTPGNDVVWDGRRVMRATGTLGPEVDAGIAAAGGPLDRYLGAGRSAALLRPGADPETVLLLGGLGWAHPGRVVRTFYDVTEAASWLGVPPDVLQCPDPRV
jgi:hypothetical protein